MKRRKTMVCHRGASSLRSGLGGRSDAAGVVAIFIVVNACGKQNSAAMPFFVRELRSAAPESYGMARVLVSSRWPWRCSSGGLKTAATKTCTLRERFGHEDEVARQFRFDLLGEGGCAGFYVAEAAVERRQLRAQVHDAQVHRTATGGARMIFRCIHQAPAETAMLPRRVHGEQAEICSLTAQFDEHTCCEPGGVLGEEKIALLQHRLQQLGGDAIALDEKTFCGAESHVDQPHDGGDVARFGPANFYLVAHLCVSGTHILSSGRGCAQRHARVGCRRRRSKMISVCPFLCAAVAKPSRHAREAATSPDSPG